MREVDYCSTREVRRMLQRQANLLRQQTSKRRDTSKLLVFAAASRLGLPSGAFPHQVTRVGSSWSRAASGSTVTASASATFTAFPATGRKKKMSTASQPPDERLVRLREAMAAADGGKGVSAYIVPSEDPHMSEYAPECFNRRPFISGFMGSAGTAVVTTDKALLWTDGRYFLAAAAELGPEWTLMKAGTPGVPDLEEWLSTSLPIGGRVGIDPWVHTVDSARKLQSKLAEAGRELVPLLEDGNLVDKVWGAKRPAAPDAPLRLHPAEWAGQTVKEKLTALRNKLKEEQASALLVTMLDEVAWLTNLRGSDVAYNPVFLSYALVTLDSATVYVESVKVVPETAQQLAEAGMQVKDYKQFLGDVKALAAAGQRLWMDPSKVSYAVYQAVQEVADSGPRGKGQKRKLDTVELNGSSRAANGTSTTAGSNGAAADVGAVFESASPVVAAKALKNATEMAGMKEAHLRDAVAICQFLCWVEALIAGGGTLTECDVDEKLTARRAAQPGFIELSFPTIAGANGNGAIIHYRPAPSSCKTVDGNTLLLLDSGAQYDCGTTDITRTMHFGTPTPHQKRCFTRVLQGHIGLDTAIWPEGTPGFVLESFARLPLWKDGLNYRHGTGHGVGAGLNVHEGPQSISMRYHITTPLAAGMICSNEPGYYEDGGFGIRVENLAFIKEADTPNRFGGVSYLGFERLTQVPITRKLMDLSLMSAADIAWVDEYHAEVWSKVSPRLEGQEEVLAWLRANTLPLKNLVV